MWRGCVGVSRLAREVAAELRGGLDLSGSPEGAGAVLIVLIFELKFYLAYESSEELFYTQEKQLMITTRLLPK